MQNNNFYTNNIQVMSKSYYYLEAKKQTQELGTTLTLKWNQRGSNITYWRNQVELGIISIKKRDKQYNNALRNSRELRIPLGRNPTTFGTSAKDWKKEIRRIQMQKRRNSKQYREGQARKEAINESLTQIKKGNKLIQLRQQQRVSLITSQLKQAVRERTTRIKFDILTVSNSFQSILNLITNKNKTMTDTQAQRLYNRIIGQGRYTITYMVNGMEFVRPVNATTRDTLIAILTNGRLDIENRNVFGSDALEEVDFTSITSMIIRYITPTRRIENRDGRFFPYINSTKEDLSKYQIFNQDQAYDVKLIKFREHCLTFTLLACGISEAVVNEIKMSYFGQQEGRVNISKKDLHMISDIIKRDITLHTIGNDRIVKQYIKAKVKEPDSEPINIALHSNHYFKFEPSPYSKLSIKNYETLSALEDFKSISKIKIVKGKSYYERNNVKINSLLLVDMLFKANYFKKLDLSKFDESKSHQELKGHIYLENIDNEQELCNSKDVEVGDDVIREDGKLKFKIEEEMKTAIKVHQDKMKNIKVDTIDTVIIPSKKERDEEYEKFLNEPDCDCDGTCEFCINEYEGPLELENIADEQLDVAHNRAVHNYVESLNLKDDKKIKQKPLISYADCESYVNKEDLESCYDNRNHRLQLLGVVSDDNDFVEIMNVNDKRYITKKDISTEQLVINDFLKIITNSGKRDGLVYFHNLKYDYHLIESYLNIKDRCEKDNQIYSITCLYKGKQIELRDSYKILPFALSKFQKELNLDKEFDKKEAIAYDYYKYENNDKRCSVLFYNSLLSVPEQLIFLKQIINDPSYSGIDKTFNPMEYYKEYLRLDCLVLKKGIQKFNQVIKEITEDKMNVYDCLTISSLTDKYMSIEGAYEGVYKMKGNLRAYVAKAVYGGRVSVNKKYKKQTITGKIADYDGVSLYPSAIHRLCRELGLPKGKARRLTSDLISKWEDMTYCIMTVNITKVNKIQQMPFIAYKNEKEGSINYTNTPPPEPVVIDSTTLKDYIKFHEIEYTITEGVYWNEGGNKKMGEVVERLFNARLKYKKSNTALANTIKLMLNSSYGKTIMKTTNTETKIVKTTQKKYDKTLKKWITQEKTDLERYIYNNFNTIKYYRKINDNSYEVERTKADNSFNRGHIGCSILSMSKRIMNEVFDIANNNEYPIYYTDTDSLHCNCEDVPRLEADYKKIYNKDLNGTKLEQFHTDFNLEGAESEIYATKSIFLGKKSYIDILESKDKNGNIITGFHIRLKGITKEGLEGEAKKYDTSYFGLYEDLAKGKEIEITLNPYDSDNQKQKVLFEYKKGAVQFKDVFTRKVKF